MVLLQLASSLLIVAGLVAIAFGYSLRDVAFGHTALVSGLIGFGAGIISFALVMSVRELRHIAQLLDVSVPALAPGTLPDLSRTAPSPRAPIPPLAEKSRPVPATAATKPPYAEVRRPLPSRPPRGPHSDAEIREPEFARAPVSALTDRIGRHERHPRKDETDGGAQGESTVAAPSSTREEPFRIREKPRDDASSADVPPPPVTAPPEPVEVAPAPASAGSATTLVKFGQVNEMTYSIYSDGSIEAVLPGGMMRFATINQLRDYLNRESPSPPAVSLA